MMNGAAAFRRGEQYGGLVRPFDLGAANADVADALFGILGQQQRHEICRPPLRPMVGTGPPLTVPPLPPMAETPATPSCRVGPQAEGVVKMTLGGLLGIFAWTSIFHAGSAEMEVQSILARVGKKIWLKRANSVVSSKRYRILA
jgi:hypothetical protein